MSQTCSDFVASCQHQDISNNNICVRHKLVAAASHYSHFHNILLSIQLAELLVLLKVISGACKRNKRSDVSTKELGM